MVFLAAACAGLGACVGEPRQVLRLPEAGLQLELPADWQLQCTRGQTLLFARPVQGGTAVPGAYLTVLRHPQRDPHNGATLDSYVELSERQARRFALDYASTARPTGPVAGRPAQGRLRSWQGHTRGKRELAVLWLQDGHGYELKAVAPPGEFERLRPGFERVAASLAPL